MKRILMCAAAAFFMSDVSAEIIVKSPNERIAVDFAMNEGKPVYKILYDGKVALEESSLGLVTNIGDYTRNLTWVKEKTKQETASGTYSLRNIKCSNVTYEYNTVKLCLAQDAKPVMEIEFRAGNRDVAFAYAVFEKGERRSCVVAEERTTFNLSSEAKGFLAPQSRPMTGFARTAPSYETKYGLGDKVGKNGWGYGYTFPCLFEIPATETEQPLWVMISETGTDGKYVGCRLLGEADGIFRIGFPDAGELNGWGCTSVQMALPGRTPWRTITLGDTPANAIESTVTWDLVEPKYSASKNYDYGKGTWSWIIGMDGSCNYNEQKRYIDFAAAMGYTSVLIDALWDRQIGRDRIAELANYGRQKGVGLYLWYNSNGSWNDAPQSPKGLMNASRERRQEMAWMQKIGIKGIKVDFFGGDKQPMMQLYEDILSDANDYGLLVIFHGCTLPRGWERMYPNFAASEAVLASENLHFSQGFCNEEARDCGAMYPFTRNTVASMDFGGSALNKYYNANNNRGSKRVTSDVYALATAVLFQSAVQHFALAPNNLTDAPQWAVDFMKAVPTTWDEVKFIDGYPGKYIIMARRSGAKWYLAGVNATGEPLKTTLQLPMFEGKTVTLYANDTVKEVKLNKKKTIKVEIPNNGGVVIN
jgi:hypothetical protein